MAVFYVGKKDIFLNTIGIKYGFLGIEGVDVRGVVMDIRHAREFLGQLVEQQKITSDEAQKLETNMRQAGISENEQVYINAACDYKMPKDFNPHLEFRTCESGKGNPMLRHGHVTGGGDFGSVISTVVEGFNLCHTLARNAEGDMDKIFSTVYVFQQIAKSDLPFDEQEQRKRYDSLTPKQREAVQRELDGGRMTSLSDLLSRLMGRSFGR